MAANSLEQRTADVRTAPRSSIYLAATLYCDGSAAPVKIRNISASGALLEGSSVPSDGSLVQLVRGGLIVHGLIAWSAEGRCGLKFSGSVDVQRWRAAPANSEQQRVDEVVRLVKAGAVPLPIPPLTHEAERRQASDPTVELARDLQRATDLLEQLGATLSLDDDVVMRHGGALQSLDIAMQMIAAVNAVIAGEADLEIEPMKLAGLRRSAEQALKRTA
jgi:hypothetical protein